MQNFSYLYFTGKPLGDMEYKTHFDTEAKGSLGMAYYNFTTNIISIVVVAITIITMQRCKENYLQYDPLLLQTFVGVFQKKIQKSPFTRSF